MGRPKQFDITLSTATGVYFEGQTVEGKVTLNLEEPLGIRECRVEFVGEAKVRWTEQRSTGKSTYTVVFSSSERYFSSTDKLWTKSTGGVAESDELAAGFYTFPFQYKLPDSLPSSYESQVGKVRYYVRAVLDRKFWFNYKTVQHFTVLSHLDLNKEPAAELPTSYSHHKFLCCLCCKSGPINGTVHLPRKGYVPGESVIIDADIENMSGRKMAKSMMRLVQVVDYHATTKTKREDHVVLEQLRPEIPPGGSDQWVRQPLTIPPVPPSYLKGCRIIDIKYFIQMNVDPKGPAFDLKVPVEIVIGTIPLQNLPPQQYAPPPMAPQQSLPAPLPSAPTGDALYSTQPSSSQFSAARPPPPTYSESVFGKSAVTDDCDDKEDDRSKAGFAPSYTYYQW